MKRLLILGASGSVGRPTVAAAVAAGFAVTAQSRDASRLSDVPGTVTTIEADPLVDEQLRACVAGQDAVIYALGLRTRAPTSFFSDTTRALVEAMKAEAVHRLVAITGVGAGETQGHGGFLYDRIIFPLFTRHVYADKNRQEALIAASGLAWTVLRPAPFTRRVPRGRLEVHSEVAAHLTLTGITRQEVATLAVQAIDDATTVRRYLFAGHR